MNELSTYLQTQFSMIDWSLNWVNIVEILIIVITMLAFYKKFIRNTHSEKLVRGIFFLLLTWVFSEILIRFDLNILGVFLKTMVILIALSLIVIFQPELRRFLGYLGQPGSISKAFWGNSKGSNAQKVNVVKEVIEAVKYLTKTKTGALIVFQKEISAGAFHDVGTKINADITTELILTIFHPNTPLHDGAMVIKDDKILAAGVLLPLTEDPKLSWKYGTRHRAAIGMSETSDSACLVVSEETGDVSVSLDGTLKKYEDLTTLKTDLETLLGYKSSEETVKKNVFNLDSLLANKQPEKIDKAQ